MESFYALPSLSSIHLAFANQKVDHIFVRLDEPGERPDFCRHVGHRGAVVHGESRHRIA